MSAGGLAGRERASPVRGRGRSVHPTYPGRSGPGRLGSLLLACALLSGVPALHAQDALVVDETTSALAAADGTETLHALDA